MKSKSIAKILSVAGSVAMLAGLATIGFSASADDTAPAKEYVEYSYDFSDPAQLNDFDSYFIANGTDKSEPAPWKDYWNLNEETGKLERIRIGNNNPGTTESNSQLYFNKAKFQYFEAEYTFELGSAWGWAELGFGAVDKGYHMESETSPSGGIFMQQEGYVDLFWLIDRVEGNPYPNQFGKDGVDYNGEAMNIEYNHSVSHTLKIKVLPGETADTVKITLSAKSGDKAEKVLLDGTKEFEDWVIANEEGYIFLQAQNDTVKYDSLVIRPLNADGSRVEKTEEGTTTTDGGAATTTTNGDAATTTTEGETTATEAPAPQSKWDYEYDFDSEEDLADFEAYWQATRDAEGGGYNASVKEEINVHWEIKDGKLVRKEILPGEENNPGSVSNNATLYFTKEQIPYFEAEVSFNFGDSWGWPQFNFGSKELGATVLRSGAGIFMSMQGEVYAAHNGTDTNDKLTEGAYDASFQKGDEHTYKVRVIKGEKENEVLMTVAVKANDGEFKTIVENHSIVDENLGGYISLQAQNDNLSFNSLKIQKLNADGSDWSAENGDKPGSPSTGVTGSAIPALLMLGAGAAFVAAYAFNKKGNK